MAARSCGMPAPLRAEVTRTSGNAAGCPARRATAGIASVCELRRLHLVALGQHDLVAHHRGGIERGQHRVIGGAEAAAGVDEHVDAF